MKTDKYKSTIPHQRIYTIQHIYSIGGSQYIAIKKAFRKALNLSSDDFVTIELMGNVLVVKKMENE